MINDEAILSALLRDYRQAIQTPEIARALIFPHEISDPCIRGACLEILLTDGNWSKARQAIVAARRPGTRALIEFADRHVAGL